MKLKYIFFSFLLMGGLTACSDFLELTPPNSIGENNFFESPEEVESAVMGVYSNLQDLTDIAWSIEGIVDDNAYPGNEGFYAEMNTFSFDPFTGLFYEYWRLSYAAISNANLVLANMDAVADETLKEQLQAEVLFLRAYIYHQLVQLYGSAPLILTPISHDDYGAMRNTPVADVYAQIIADLKLAVNQLPASRPSEDAGRVTQWAAKGILAKAYLSGGNKLDAQSTLKDIIDNGGFGLMEHYAEIFSVEMNKEILFAVRYSASDNEHQTFSYTFSPKGEFGGVMATENLLNSYEPGDIRKDISSGDDGGQRIINKYQSIGISTEQSGVDWVALRYADILLLYAELANESNPLDTDAISYLNLVRGRASLPELTFSTQQELADAIAQERRVELAFENHRWFDLKRYGNAVETIDAYLKEAELPSNIKAHHLLFPFPNREINLAEGSLMQNDGY
ncbi:RagB/SusD family nutrient uptake outer membrane protein [Persicobacter diffluens]|uniref:Membrane protein n=1 Tax=Persicobacter diffluens TaxID=981 RepID=A0AAN4W2H0_9BACT|nr:membrane protein [Persicobacter diffluens]